MLQNSLNQYDNYFRLLRDYPVDFEGYLAAIREFDACYGFEKIPRKSKDEWDRWYVPKGTWLLLYQRALWDRPFEARALDSKHEDPMVAAVADYLEGVTDPSDLACLDSLRVLEGTHPIDEYSVTEQQGSNPSFAVTRVARMTAAGNGVGLRTKASSSLWIPYGTRYAYQLKPLGILTRCVGLTSPEHLAGSLRSLLFESWTDMPK